MGDKSSIVLSGVFSLAVVAFCVFGSQLSEAKILVTYGFEQASPTAQNEAAFVFRDWEEALGWGGNTITELSQLLPDNNGVWTETHVAGTGNAPYRYTSRTSRNFGNIGSALVLRATTGTPPNGYILMGAPPNITPPNHAVSDDKHDRSQFVVYPPSMPAAPYFVNDALYQVAFSMKIAVGDTFSAAVDSKRVPPAGSSLVGPWALFAQFHPLGGDPVFSLMPSPVAGESTSTQVLLYATTEQTTPTSRKTLQNSTLKTAAGKPFWFQRGAWYDFVIRSRFGANGQVEIWMKRQIDSQGTQWLAWSYHGPVQFVGPNPRYNFTLDVYRGLFTDIYDTASPKRSLIYRPKKFEVHFDEIRVADDSECVTTLMPPPTFPGPVYEPTPATPGVTCK